MPQYKINNKFIDVTCHNTQDCVFKNTFPNTEKRQKKNATQSRVFLKQNYREKRETKSNKIYAI